MNNLSSLGLISCFLFSMVLNGTSVRHFSHNDLGDPAYITNNSSYTIYFKPESRLKNPGLDPNSAYPLAPGQSYYLPFDAIVTPSLNNGEIYRLPTGSRVIVDEKGLPVPANLIARAGLILPAYGKVCSPCEQFAKLANPKGVLYVGSDVCNVH